MDIKVSQNKSNTDKSIFFFAAENLITILQARDSLSVNNQSPPVRGPEGCSYNSHGSSVQESPSERESPANSVLVLNLADGDANIGVQPKNNNTWPWCVQVLTTPFPLPQLTI